MPAAWVFLCRAREEDMEKAPPSKKLPATRARPQLGAVQAQQEEQFRRAVDQHLLTLQFGFLSLDEVRLNAAA